MHKLCTWTTGRNNQILIKKVFLYGNAKAFYLTLKAHITGSSILWTGDYQVAESKADKVKAEGPDPKMADRGAQPLKVDIEEIY